MKKLLQLFLVLLCACMLGSSVQPFISYASLEEESAEEEVVEEDAGAEENTSSSVEASYQDEIAAYNNEIDNLKKESERLKAERDGIRDEVEQKKWERNSIDQEIVLIKEHIALLEGKIALVEENITQKGQDIEQKQAEYDESYETLRQRLRAMYMQDTTSTLGLLLGADSFSDLLTRTEYIRRIAQHDRNMLEDLNDARLALEEEKSNLESDKILLESDQKDAEESKKLLDQKYAQAQSQLGELQQMEAEYNADLANNKKAEDAAKAALDQIYKEIQWSKNPYIGGVMAWPVPQLYTISCEYGPRFNNSDYHTGIDLTGSGAYGKAIVAANAGTVVKANWAYTPGRGYGMYVMLDHGGSISTLYGHCSHIVVKEGDVVQKGQKIAEVGSTGWSTGPHLHFEVRINGKHVPPKSYIIGSK